MSVRSPNIAKRFELKFKQFFLKAILPEKNPIIINKSCELFGNSSKILLLRNDRIGDLLISSGIIRTLRQTVTNARIDVLLSIKNKSAQNSVLKYVDSIYVYSKKTMDFIKLIKRLRSNNYDLVIDLFDKTSLTSSLIVKFIKARHSLGIDKENKNIYTHIVHRLDRNAAHIIDRTAQILLPFGINPADADLTPEYQLSPFNLIPLLHEKKLMLRLGIILSGSDRSKFWGINNNISLINKIKLNWNEIEIVLFGTKDYSDDINAITSRSPATAAPLVESFDEFAQMLSSCDFIITPDTSAVHLASAFKIPAIVLYSHDDTNIAGAPWTPYNSPHKSIITNKSLSEGISPDMVYDEFCNLFNELF